MERKKYSEYARRIIDLTREELACAYPFLTPAIYALRPLENPGGKMIYGIGSEGDVFLYEPSVLVKDFVEGKDLAALFLHSILHCLFFHPFFASLHKDRRLWDLSCDICIRDIMSSLTGGSAVSEAGGRGRALIAGLKKELPVMNAEWIYAFLEKGIDVPDEFHVDDHTLWYSDEMTGAGRNPGEGDEYEKLTKDMLPGAREGSAKVKEDNNTKKADASLSRKKWERIAGEIELSLKRSLRSSSGRGDFAGYFIEVLNSIERRHTDYGMFLRNFGARAEVPRLDPESFDYALYTYGLDIYGDMPVIEPLEYSERNTVREFAVAIDTSYSCSSQVIRDFLEKTYDILFSSMDHGERKKMVIFQCDCEIRDEKVISDREELMRYMSEVSVHGRGGTDFRPVFRRIDQLVKEKFFSSLQGLMYFTDGDGIFPDMPPKHKTAFVMPRGISIKEVPPWAMKVGIET